MSRGGEQKSDYKKFYANLVAKKDTTPYFNVERKEPANYQLLAAEWRKEKNAQYVVYKEQELSGMLIKAEIGQEEYQGKTKQFCKLVLRDHGVQEDYAIKFGVGTKLGRTILNGLLTIKDFSVIKIKVYERKDGGAGVSLRYGSSEEKPTFRFDYESYKLMVREYEVPDGKMYDWRKVDEMFIEEFNKVMPERLRVFLAMADHQPKKVSEKVEKTNTSRSTDSIHDDEEETPDILGQVREERANNPIGKGSTSADLEAAATNKESDLPF